MEWALLTKAHLGASSRELQWNVMRLVLGSQQIHFYLLCDDESENPGFHSGTATSGISDNEWALMKESHCFVDSEIEVLQKYAAFKPLLPLSWALDEVKRELIARGGGDGGGREFSAMPQVAVHAQFQACAFRLRGHMNTIVNLLKQPVPFPYFHVLKLLLLVGLFIVSYAIVGLETGDLTAWTAALSLFAFSVVCAIMIGLQEIAVAMSDPFGDDDVDFDVDSFLKAAYNNCVALLSDERQPRGGAPAASLYNPLSPPPPQARGLLTSGGGGGAWGRRPSKQQGGTGAPAAAMNGGAAAAKAAAPPQNRASQHRASWVKADCAIASQAGGSMASPEVPRAVPVPIGQVPKKMRATGNLQQLLALDSSDQTAQGGGADEDRASASSVEKAHFSA